MAAALLLALGIGAFALVVLAGRPAAAQSTGEEDRSPCAPELPNEGSEPQSLELAPTASGDPIQLKVSDERDIEVNFRQSREHQESDFEFLLPSAGDLPADESVIFEIDHPKNSDGVEWPSDSLRVTSARVSADGQGIDVEFCIDPSGLSAGRWSGFLESNDPRIQRIQVPLEATLQTDVVLRPWIIALLAAVAVLIYQHVLTLTRDPSRDLDTSPRRAALLWSFVALVASVFLAIGFVLSVQDDAGWKGDGPEMWALAIAVGAAASAAYPTVAAAAVGVAALVRRFASAGGAENHTGPSEGARRSDDEQVDDD